MKKEFLSSLLLSIACLLLFCIVYPSVVWGIARLADGKGEGITVKGAGGQVYYANIAQKFTADKYFASRPSAVDYNAAGSGGSNKGPNNPGYLADVQKRIDTFMAHNPGVNKADIPSDLVTASGSGLDPDISIAGARVQVARIAAARRQPADKLYKLIAATTEGPLFGMFGPQKVNVLKLNMALDNLK